VTGTQRFAGLRVLVTGAAGGGIGEATARRFARDGADVVVTDAHERRCREVAVAIDAEAIALDVGDRDAIDRAVALAGPVDVLVNNAAVNVLGTVVDFDPENWDRVMAVDLSGCWYLAKRLLPGMIERRRGSIVNVTSVAGMLNAGHEGPYAAAKAGLHSLTRTIAGEGGPFGIRCNAVAPGIVRTRFVEKNMATLAPELERTPLGRFAEPSEIAAVITWLASDDASFVTGAIINASGGWYMDR
jgi:NAD(P)-dependent dehydrogenase (short-subunit alcohol dehydrogenase family)